MSVEDAQSSGGRDWVEPPANASERFETICVELRLEINEPDPPLTGWLDVELTKLARLAGLAQGFIGVAVVDDAKMIQLHQQYRQDPNTTDVLTFKMSECSQACVEGDVVICLDEADRQATVRGHPTRNEVLLYALHGLLHLLGYDDQDVQDAKQMHRREDELLVSAGYDPIYGVFTPNGHAAG